MVDKSMNETVSNRRVIHGAAGHIRIRREPGSKMKVDLANGAYSACGSRLRDPADVHAPSAEKRRGAR
jgi:hypothetical protein